MHRRELLRLLGTTALLALVPPSAEGAFRFGQAAHRAARAHDLQALSAVQAELVTTVADLIIPRTDPPGASDVGVTEFVDHLLANWYHDDERDRFLAGLAELDRRSGGSFTALAVERQTALLEVLDGVPGEPGSAEAGFAQLKSLTVYGYFTSERVVKEVTHEPVIPGRFEGCGRT
jgi:hypothetical protein